MREEKNKIEDNYLVIYTDKVNGKLARIETYSLDKWNGMSNSDSDIESYLYGYNAEKIKPSDLYKQLQQAKQTNTALKAELDRYLKALNSIKEFTESLCYSVMDNGLFDLKEDIKKELSQALEDIK